SHDLSPQAFIFAGIAVAILITMNRLKLLHSRLTALSVLFFGHPYSNQVYTPLWRE
ncbi:pH-dependent sodium/proton antiporter, partial [Pasteurella multocida subsp. multocida str. Anand1_cattle]